MNDLPRCRNIFFFKCKEKTKKENEEPSRADKTGDTGRLSNENELADG